MRKVAKNAKKCLKFCKNRAKMNLVNQLKASEREKYYTNCSGGRDAKITEIHSDTSRKTRMLHQTVHHSKNYPNQITELSEVRFFCAFFVLKITRDPKILRFCSEF